MNQPVTTPRSPRRWFRFSLRTMLVGVTIICCVLAWQLRVVRERQAALIEMRDGGTFQVITAEAWTERFPAGAPVSPPVTIPAVRRWLGDQAIQEVWYITFYKPASEEDLVRFKKVFPEATFHESLPEPCHPGCFPRGTLVETPQGPRAIETIQPGELITAVGPTRELFSAAVQTVFVTDNQLWKVSTDAGLLYTTKTQPLCLENGQTRTAGELKPGDKIRRWQDKGIRVATVLEATRTDRAEKVFNLILGDSEIFVAGGFLARSKPPAAVAVP